MSAQAALKDPVAVLPGDREEGELSEGSPDQEQDQQLKVCTLKSSQPSTISPLPFSAEDKDFVKQTNGRDLGQDCQNQPPIDSNLETCPNYKREKRGLPGSNQLCQIHNGKCPASTLDGLLQKRKFREDIEDGEEEGQEQVAAVYQQKQQQNDSAEDSAEEIIKKTIKSQGGSTAKYKPTTRYDRSSEDAYYSQTDSTPSSKSQTPQVIKGSQANQHKLKQKKKKQKKLKKKQESAATKDKFFTTKQGKRFKANQTPYLQKDLCKFYLTGNCHRGVDCSFSHTTKDFPCKYLHATGYCEKGGECRFSHLLLNPDEITKFIRQNEEYLKEIYEKTGKTNLGDFYLNYLRQKAEQEAQAQMPQNVMLPPQLQGKPQLPVPHDYQSQFQQPPQQKIQLTPQIQQTPLAPQLSQQANQGASIINQLQNLMKQGDLTKLIGCQLQQNPLLQQILLSASQNQSVPPPPQQFVQPSPQPFHPQQYVASQNQGTIGTAPQQNILQQLLLQAAQKASPAQPVPQPIVSDPRQQYQQQPAISHTQGTQSTTSATEQQLLQQKQMLVSALQQSLMGFQLQQQQQYYQNPQQAAGASSPNQSVCAQPQPGYQPQQQYYQQQQQKHPQAQQLASKQNHQQKLYDPRREQNAPQPKSKLMEDLDKVQQALNNKQLQMPRGRGNITQRIQDSSDSEGGKVDVKVAKVEQNESEEDEGLGDFFGTGTESTEDGKQKLKDKLSLSGIIKKSV